MAEFIRWTAEKIRIKEIKEGTLSLEDGHLGLLTPSGKKIFRANLVGVVVNKIEEGNLINILFDDGSDRINLRFFEKLEILDEIDIGDVLLVIGRVREFGNEKYLSPEIVRKVGKEWLKLRDLELRKEELKKEELNKKESVPHKQEIKEIIKQLDQGEGVSIEELAKKLKTNKVEEVIKEMISSGEVFLIDKKIKLLI